MHFLNIVFGFGVTGVFCALCGDNQQSSVGGQYCFFALGKDETGRYNWFRLQTKGKGSGGLVFEQGARDLIKSLLTYSTKPRNIVQTLLKIANALN